LPSRRHKITFGSAALDFADAEIAKALRDRDSIVTAESLKASVRFRLHPEQDGTLFGH
jgi:hypothetical protein